MRGRERLAFRSNLGFCFPGVAEELTLPVKTNAPLQKKISKSLCYTYQQTYLIPWIKKAPGVFVAEKVVVLTLLVFRPSAVCFWGVLEATHGDMRAGVSTIDPLYPLSHVVSWNLHKNTFGCWILHTWSPQEFNVCWVFMFHNIKQNEHRFVWQYLIQNTGTCLSMMSSKKNGPRLLKSLRDGIYGSLNGGRSCGSVPFKESFKRLIPSQNKRFCLWCCSTVRPFEI